MKVLQTFGLIMIWLILSDLVGLFSTTVTDMILEGTQPYYIVYILMGMYVCILTFLEFIFFGIDGIVSALFIGFIWAIGYSMYPSIILFNHMYTYCAEIVILGLVMYYIDEFFY